MSKKYIGVNAENIRLFIHAYADNYGKKNYSRPDGITFSIGYATELFEKYGIPKEYQKMYMIVNNNLSMLFQDIRNHSINLYAAKLNRFKVREYTTGTEIFIAYNCRHELFGQQALSQWSFTVRNCFECSEDEIVKTMIVLREKGLLDNYIKAIAEISHLRVETQCDYNEEEKDFVKK